MRTAPPTLGIVLLRPVVGAHFQPIHARLQAPLALVVLAIGTVCVMANVLKHFAGGNHTLLNPALLWAFGSRFARRERAHRNPGGGHFGLLLLVSANFFFHKGRFSKHSKRVGLVLQRRSMRPDEREAVVPKCLCGIRFLSCP